MTANLIKEPYNQNGIYNPYYLNKTQITNRILEIPQRINYEISSVGRLILKAGSKVYISTNGTFQSVTLTENTLEGGGGEWTTDHSRSLFAVYVPSLNKVLNVDFDHTFAQSTAPTSFLSNRALWFDTTNNIVKMTTDSGATWQICSLPIMAGRPGETNIGWRGYVDNVFNGAGFIAQYAWIAEGLRVLISNGYNSDGTYRNKEYITEKFYMTNETGKSSKHLFLNLRNPYKLHTWGSIYQTGKTPTLLANTQLVFSNELTNYLELYDINGTLKQVGDIVYLGQLDKSSDASITSLSLEPFKILTQYGQATLDEPDLSAPNGIPYNTEYVIKEPGWVYFNTHLRCASNYQNPTSSIQVYGKIIDNDAPVSVYGNLLGTKWDGSSNTITNDNMTTLFVRVYPGQRVKLHTQSSAGSAAVASYQCIFYPLKRKGV